MQQNKEKGPESFVYKTKPRGNKSGFCLKLWKAVYIDNFHFCCYYLCRPWSNEACKHAFNHRNKSHWLKYVTNVSLIRDGVKHVLWTCYRNLAWCIVNNDKEELRLPAVPSCCCFWGIWRGRFASLVFYNRFTSYSARICLGKIAAGNKNQCIWPLHVGAPL